MPPRYLLSSASLYFSSLRRCFQLAHKAGFDGLELSLTPASARSTPAQMRALAQEMGLLLPSVHPPPLPLPGWRLSPATFERLGRLARSLPGCRIVVMHVPNVHRQGDPGLARFQRDLDALQQALAGSPVSVALENRSCRPGKAAGFFDSPEALLDLSRRHGCHIVFDTAHASTLSRSLLEVYSILRHRMVNIHLSDAISWRWWNRSSYLRAFFAHHRVPGQGALPLRPLLAQLARDGYDGLITLELSPLALRFWDRPAAFRTLERSLQTCRLWAEESLSKMDENPPNNLMDH
jgi:sugar phosphate isomerase/epimerase